MNSLDVKLDLLMIMELEVPTSPMKITIDGRRWWKTSSNMSRCCMSFQSTLSKQLLKLLKPKQQLLFSKMVHKIFKLSNKKGIVSPDLQ